MELTHRRHKTSKFESEDVIRRMPDIVITNILDRLPLPDAVMTSVLSRKWRFKWTMLSQLIFDEAFFSFLSKKKKFKSNLVISRILLHLRGSIDKFVISIKDGSFDGVLDDEDISHCILFLSRKGIKDLTLNFSLETSLKLPTHLFSCLELKHLTLRYCNYECDHVPRNFKGFPNLLSLELLMGLEGGCELVELIDSCPLLETLKLHDNWYEAAIKLIKVAKLKNLKILSLPLCCVVDTDITSSGTIFKLLDALPKLQELHLDFEYFKLTDNIAKKGFSTVFPCLKNLKLSGICLDNDMMSSFTFELITLFPNLQTLEITTNIESDVEPSPPVEFNTMGPFQLRRVVFKYLNASESEICLIKGLLACSPFLKNIVVHPLMYLSSDENLMFAMKLLKLPRASSVAEIDLFPF